MLTLLRNSFLTESVLLFRSNNGPVLCLLSSGSRETWRVERQDIVKEQSQKEIGEMFDNWTKRKTKVYCSIQRKILKSEY